MKHFNTGIFALLLFVFTAPNLPAQDTLRVIHYNLLHYGGSGPGGCTLTSTSVKNGYLSTIINYARPDIFTINEMGPSSLYADNILVNVLDPIDPDYARTTFTNYATSEITNHLFYNSSKLGVAKEQAILHSFRDINYYKLYYKDPGLAPGSDTTFIHCVVVHIDGTGATTPTAISQANAIMAFMDGLGEPGNYLLLGDMNSDASSDDAMALFYAHSNLDCRFYDPINMPGTWHNASSFAAIHTQSTAVSRSDCGASGGLDDRFDHIMISRFVKDDSARVRYATGSYRAIGQDGLHYNDDVDGSPTNTSVPSAVASALHNMSDHLPVQLNLVVTSLPAGYEQAQDLPLFQVRPNPFRDQFEVILNHPSSSGPLTAEIMSLTGQVLQTTSIGVGVGQVDIHAEGIAAGVYLLRIADEEGVSFVRKVVRM